MAHKPFGWVRTADIRAMHSAIVSQPEPTEYVAGEATMSMTIIGDGRMCLHISAPGQKVSLPTTARDMRLLAKQADRLSKAMRRSRA